MVFLLLRLLSCEGLLPTRMGVLSRRGTSPTRSAIRSAHGPSWRWDGCDRGAPRGTLTGAWCWSHKKWDWSQQRLHIAGARVQAGLYSWIRNLWFLCILCVLGENRESGPKPVVSVHSACFGVKIVNPGRNLCFLCILRGLSRI